MFICIIATLFLVKNTYAADTVYSLNKYKEEKFETIIDSYDKENEQDGFIAAGTILKETKTIDGYQRYEQPIRVEIELNQEITVTVNNLKEEKPEIDTTNVGRNEKANAEYVRNQKKEEMMEGQISLKEYIDPFTGKKNDK